MDQAARGERRHLLAALALAAAARSARAGTAERALAPAMKEGAADKVRARYRADAPDVQAFYRVNRY